MAKNRHLVLAILDRETTQIEVARKAGIHESRLSRLVNGHDEPTADEKKAIAKALRTSIDQLFPEAIAS